MNRPRSCIALLVALYPLTLFLPAAHAQDAPARENRTYDFYAHGPYRKGIPRPSEILGYEAGKKHSTFRDQERVFLALAEAAKDRVRLVEYGKSVEGRPLRIALVSAPENLAKLEAIRAGIGKLADPRLLASDAEADRIIQTTPALTWINHCIHGNETASFESAMWLLYTLAASDAPNIQEILHKTVVIINPVFNPDGHERFVVYNNSIAMGSPDGFAYEKGEPWAIQGRFNHYRFDMNRDKLAQSQLETRQETAIFLHWHPQVFVDQHGQVENYFFPPNSMSVNREADRARTEKWTTIFGKANAAAFDHYGWSYVNRETYDLFYAGYLDIFTTLSGAIGMTYETDGGRDLARRKDDGTISTLRDGIAHHFESALATAAAAAKNREMLLRDFLAYRRGAITEGITGKMRRIVLLPGSDPGRAGELAMVLRRVGVEVKETTGAFRSEKAHAYATLPKTDKTVTKEFPAGTLIVDLAQPQGRVARAFLEPDNDFEPEFTKEQLARRERNEKKNENEAQEGYDFYDTTAWSLPYAYGMEAYWTEDAPDTPAHALEPNAQGSITLRGMTGGVRGGRASVAYAFLYDRDAAAILALRLLQEGYRVAVATKPLRANGTEWPRGTFFLRVGRNPESLHARLNAMAQALGVEVHALNSGYADESSVGLGSESVANLRKPVIAVVADDMVAQTSFGGLWYMLERQIGLEFTAVRLSTLKSDVLSRFNVVILPEGYGYFGALGKSGVDKLKEWVGNGNALLGIGPGGQWFTEKEAGLSSAVPVGSDVKPDAKPVEPKPGEKAKPKKPLTLPGAIFRAELDTTHFLGFGYDHSEIAVPLGGATFLKPTTKGSNVVKFGKGPLRLSGFIWPDNTEELLANTAYVIDEPIGSGHAILYLDDPNFRAFWLGLRRLFLNGILFGPSRSVSDSSGLRERE